MSQEKLQAYFDRVGYEDNARATLATFSDLLRCHVLSIPFENLDVMLGSRLTLAQ